MTDRSKSQRKRRLQLNAEEFAPPPDIYEASAEPRLDETWVQYYGGEKQGGLKRLLPVDEEPAAEQLNNTAASTVYPPTTDADYKEPDEAPLTETPRSPQIEETEALEANSPGPSSRPVVSSLDDFRKHESTKTVASYVPPSSDSPLTVKVPRRDGRTTTKAEKKGDSTPGLPSPSPQAKSDALSFEEWSKRWSPWLKRGGSIKVCAAFFELTHARGSAECFTSNSAIMEITKLSRAQCIRNIHYLIEMGFLDELREVNSREAKGTYYRFNLVPRSLTTI